ncbi:MAG: HlyD family type I secretion periplasmic adaptor subunit [Rhodospirillales bacterium]|nr:HlyD family type I secretion periplasmic adaptor subunit [Alphaproteobacteria bacterium]MBL6948788.1 HlyD family type I secretion periplasmic adaptor subunit [Rhodospirillales bacterium]
MSAAAIHESGNASIFHLGRRRPRPLSQSLLIPEEGGPKVTARAILAAGGVTLALLLWAGFIPVDDVVTANGEIVPGAEGQGVSHPEGGLISDILVAEGDIVEAGQVLVRLDDKAIREKLEDLETRHTRLAMLAAQLKALGRGEEPDFSFARPKFRAIADNELLIFASLKKLTEKRQRVLGEQVQANRQKLKNITEQEQDLSNKSLLLEEELLLREDLFKKGLTPKKVLLDAKKKVNQAHLDLADLARGRKSTARVLDTMERREAELKTRLRERALDELTVLTREIDILDKDMKDQAERLNRVTISAPVKGVVKGISRHTLGKTLSPGAGVLNVVPIDGVLLVEVRIRPESREGILPGQPVSVRVRAPGFFGHGAMTGSLKNISSSTFSDSRGREFYKGTIELDRALAVRGPGQAPLLPGMTIEAGIRTGSQRLFRTFLN